jgi:Hemerythrin HHE cation binding domain
MLEWLTGNDTSNAIALLKHDHDTLRELFQRFEDAKSRPAKVKIAGQAILELKIHSAIEEDIFYPAIRKKIEKARMNESDEEHHVAKVLIAELEQMDGREDHYEAKFKVLTENVVHHLKEEEDELFPKAKALDIDYDEVGRQMLQHRQKLTDQGVPTFAEEIMVAASHGQNDSPAEAARKTTKPPMKR